jgi:hypothetical protein
VSAESIVILSPGLTFSGIRLRGFLRCGRIIRNSLCSGLAVMAGGYVTTVSLSVRLLGLFGGFLGGVDSRGWRIIASLNRLFAHVENFLGERLYLVPPVRQPRACHSVNLQHDSLKLNPTTFGVLAELNPSI